MTPRNTQAPSSPTTEAGRDLIARMMILFRAQHESVESFTADILAIEQQARDEGRREAVRPGAIQLDARIVDWLIEQTGKGHPHDEPPSECGACAAYNYLSEKQRVAGLNASGWVGPFDGLALQRHYNPQTGKLWHHDDCPDEDHRFDLHAVLDRVAGLNASESPPTQVLSAMCQRCGLGRYESIGKPCGDSERHIFDSRDASESPPTDGGEEAHERGHLLGLGDASESGQPPERPNGKPRRRFPCPDCKEWFWYRADLSRHRNAIHPGESGQPPEASDE